MYSLLRNSKSEHVKFAESIMVGVVSAIGAKIVGLLNNWI